MSTKFNKDLYKNKNRLHKILRKDLLSSICTLSYTLCDLLALRGDVALETNHSIEKTKKCLHNSDTH